MTEQADITRLQILQAAAHQFATQPYSQVNLDDILATADVTKGALYFHFRSKHALATAVIEHRAVVALSAFEQILAHGLPGLETMIDVTYMVAVSDIGDQMARAGFNLLESIGRFDGLQAKVLDAWATNFAAMTRRAISEGDILDGAHEVAAAQEPAADAVPLPQVLDPQQRPGRSGGGGERGGDERGGDISEHVQVSPAARACQRRQRT